MTKNIFSELNINKIESVTYGKIERKKDFVFSPHYHPRIELMYIAHGQLEVSIFSQTDNRLKHTETLSGNNYILLNSDVPHGLTALTDVIFTTTEFSYDDEASSSEFGFPTKQLHRDSPALFSDMEMRGYHVCNDHANLKDVLAKIQQFFSDFNVSAENKLHAEEKYLYRLYIQELFVTLCLNATKNKPQGIRLVRIINEYLKSNFQRKLDLDKLAELAGVSKFYMEKLYKKTTGQTIRQFHTVLRLEKAKSLLKNTNLSVEQIARECGFNIRQQLIYNFKNYYNVTPSEYADSQAKALFEAETPKNISNETYDFVSPENRKN